MKKKQVLAQQSKQVYKLSKLIKQKLIDLDDLADIIPGILHINSRADLGLEFMSKQGCDIMRYSNEELKTLGASVLQKHQSDYTLNVVYPQLFKELSDNDKDKVVPFFQDWQHKGDEMPLFHFTTTKILNDTQLISITLFPEVIETFSDSVNDLFGINKIYEQYFSRFMLLTKREKEILKLLSMELTRKEISDTLFIAERTVKKHCENIYRKLGTNKRTEIERIAKAIVAL